MFRRYSKHKDIPEGISIFDNKAKSHEQTNASTRTGSEKETQGTGSGHRGTTEVIPGRSIDGDIRVGGDRSSKPTDGRQTRPGGQDSRHDVAVSGGNTGEVPGRGVSGSQFSLEFAGQAINNKNDKGNTRGTDSRSNVPGNGVQPGQLSKQKTEYDINQRKKDPDRNNQKKIVLGISYFNR